MTIGKPKLNLGQSQTYDVALATIKQHEETGRLELKVEKLREEVLVNREGGSIKPETDLSLQFSLAEYYGMPLATGGFTMKDLQMIYLDKGRVEIAINGHWLAVDEDDLQRLFTLTLGELREYFRGDEGEDKKNNPCGNRG